MTLSHVCTCGPPPAGYDVYCSVHLECSECEGVGSRLADCTTFDRGCGCNGPRVTCEACDGEGVREVWE
jgi:hypothetical protein